MDNSLKSISFNAINSTKIPTQKSQPELSFGIKGKKVLEDDAFQKENENLQIKNKVLTGLSLATSAAAITGFIKEHKISGQIKELLTSTGTKLKGSIKGNIDELGKLATRDGMTGLKNKKVFIADMHKCIAEMQTSLDKGIKTHIIEFDLDFFKSVNDILGHDVGDKFLVEYSKMLGDGAYRIGGEEFTMIAKSKDVKTTVTSIKEIAKKYCTNPSIQEYKAEFMEKVTAKIATVSENLGKIEKLGTQLSAQTVENPKQINKELISFLETCAKSPEDKALLKALSENKGSVETPEFKTSVQKSLVRISSLLDGDLAQYKKWQTHVDNNGFTMSAGLGPLKTTEVTAEKIKDLMSKVKTTGDQYDQELNDLTREVYGKTFHSIDKALYKAKEQGRSSLALSDGKIEPLGK